jgi:hypothetical protein
MLYLHNLTHLTPKSADVESVPLIREIKQKVGYPLTEQKFSEHISAYFPTHEELSKIEFSLLLVEPTREIISKLAEETKQAQESNPLQAPLYESPSLTRANQILQEMPPALDVNLGFMKELAMIKNSFIQEGTQVFNALPKLRTQDDKIIFNNKLNSLFKAILRNKEFTFNYVDVINEMHTSHIAGLVESLHKGFFFHYTLEEELKKLEFEAIKGRIPREKLDEVEAIRKKVAAIKSGVDVAYACNLRMVHLAVVLYSYIKWLNSGSL